MDRGGLSGHHGRFRCGGDRLLLRSDYLPRSRWAGRGPNSHFYTLEAPECTAVKQDPGWTYEAPNKYWLLRPASSVAAGCGPGTTPIYRVYNNRFAFNDSNHRYMTRTALYDQMRAQGWMGEGVVMCAPG